MSPVRLVLALALAFAAWAPAARAEEPLPPGVVARVHGRDVRESDVLDRLVLRWANTERGRGVLEQLVDDTCVANEARRRGVGVTDEEVAEYVKKVDQTIRQQTGNARSIADVYREQKTTDAEFALVAREYLVRQKMAAEDLGTKPGEEVTEARLKLWLSMLRRRSDVRTTGLPEGVLATVGDTPVDRLRFAAALRESLPEEMVTDARNDLVLQVAAEHALAQAKIAVSDADVDAEIALLRRRFEEDPRVKGTGVTFDQFLRQSRGTSESELRGDAQFRSRIGLDRLLSRRITDEMVRRQWEDNRDAYGERALVRQIYVAAGEAGGQFKMRTFPEAYETALRAKAAVLEGAGVIGGDGAQRRPLRDVVGAVAKQFEDDAKRKQAAGEPVAWTRVHLAGEDALAKSVFECELGTLQGPIRSRVGYHLVLVEERRPAPAFDDVRDNVREDLLRREMANFQLELRTDPDVVLAK